MFCGAILATKPFLSDIYLHATTWDGLPSLPKGRKLKVAILEHDDVVLPHPPVLRALKMAKEKLSRHPGIELVEYKPYKHDLGYELTVSLLPSFRCGTDQFVQKELYFPENGKIFKDNLAATGEDMSPLTAALLEAPVKHHDAWEILDLFERRDLVSFQLQMAIRSHRCKYRDAHARHWDASEIDVLLCPAFPGSAPPHDNSTYWSYTSQWNVTDYPGCIFPSGVRVDPAKDPKPTTFKAMSAADQKNYDLCQCAPETNTASYVFEKTTRNCKSTRPSRCRWSADAGPMPWCLARSS
jgi:amidase